MLAALKEYRTPRAFRAFARTYILLIGVFYGPYYVYLSHIKDIHGDTHENMPLAIVYALLVQIVLSGLFHVMIGLEDPFGRVDAGPRGLDVVRVNLMFETCRKEMLLTRHLSEYDWKHDP